MRRRCWFWVEKSITEWGREREDEWNCVSWGSCAEMSRSEKPEDIAPVPKGMGEGGMAEAFMVEGLEGERALRDMDLDMDMLLGVGLDMVAFGVLLDMTSLTRSLVSPSALAVASRRPSARLRGRRARDIDETVSGRLMGDWGGGGVSQWH